VELSALQQRGRIESFEVGAVVPEVAAVPKLVLVAAAEAVAPGRHPARASSSCKPTVVTTKKDIVELLPRLHATMFRIQIHHDPQLPPSSNDLFLRGEELS